MNKSLAEAQDMVLGRINLICNKFGLNNILAQLYTLLYLSGNPLSLNDMVERLEISKGSASVNIRRLERYGAVRRVWVKGSRKDYYEAEPDIVRVLIDRVKLIVHMRLSEIYDMMKTANQILDSADLSSSDEAEDEQTKVFRQRLGKLVRFHSQAQSLLDLFNSGLLNNLLNNELIKSKKESNYVTSLE